MAVDGEREIEVTDALDVTGLLPDAVPLAVVWGRADTVLPAANACLLAGRADACFVDGAGHMVHLEKPNAVLDAGRSATNRS
ncbi:hypothetical protein [Actinokineospora sp.]|uniref:hypothetical protein n=1 Tax=Actinokineospora sp. TaxID=1872133 RepID=UPI004037C2AF